MKSTSKKRSTKAIKLLLVSSAFILQGCRPKKEDLPVPAMTPEQMAQSQLTEEQKEALREANGGQLPVVQSMPQAQQQPNHFGSHSSWGYNPFFWGYGSGRSNNWSSSSSSRSSSNSGFFSGSNSGPASHFGAQNSTQPAASHSTTSSSSTTHSSTVHTPTTHTSSSHVASSPSVSRGGFGGHASASS